MLIGPKIAGQLVQRNRQQSAATRPRPTSVWEAYDKLPPDPSRGGSPPSRNEAERPERGRGLLDGARSRAQEPRIFSSQDGDENRRDGAHHQALLERCDEERRAVALDD